MSLLIATPMYGAQCRAEHFMSCLALKESLTENGVEHDWLVTTNESLITRARNTTAAWFLESGYQKLMFIDGDIEFDPGDVARFYNLNVPVICGAYRMKRPGAMLSVCKDGRLVDAKAYTEPTTVDYAGTGFMMIDRSVFEVLQESHPEWEYEEGFEHKPCWAFFQDPIENGAHWSEDYFFCVRWRALGGEVIWHPEVRLTHWGQYGYGSE